MKLNRFKEIALDGVVRQNPTFKLVLGTCPTLAMTVAAAQCLGMGVAVTFVLVCSNVIISLLRNIIPDRVRIPCFIVIIATFVTIVRMAMEAFLPDLYDSLGVFLPLIVVNCIILGRAESFASHNPVGESALDGLFMGIGFTLAITLMGMVREVLGKASLFGLQLWDASKFSISFFSQSAGAFLTYGLFIAVFTLCYNAVERKARHIAAKHAATTEVVKEAE
ncbi:electron transport complex RnfABCDGE type E subunit [Corallococcus sp. CAG:1435]|uniref:Ion-translocating oxidoreductase complex subunit E n=1 Tax=Candidatus Fimimonas gallinarum TaxID=2840821 RepID=A0A9D1E318_9BACT|nr:electron transport complex RnfABCDGE type E subunit [Corallococcus sp. CAG:1435]HIR65379.1 electron transport complex subunit E [Candidatus Fimimonas gallinarum]